jgi:hypothetical protein
MPARVELGSGTHSGGRGSQPPVEPQFQEWLQSHLQSQSHRWPSCFDLRSSSNELTPDHQSVRRVFQPASCAGLGNVRAGGSENAQADFTLFAGRGRPTLMGISNAFRT